MKILFLMILVPSFAFAHGGAEGELAIGKGIVAFDRYKGFKLSNEAQTRMKFKYQSVAEAEKINIPRDALVQALAETQVYVRQDEYFKAITVKIISKTKENIFIQSSALKKGQEIVIGGINFLRVIDMDLNSSEEDEHADEHSDEHTDEHGADHDDHEKGEHKEEQHKEEGHEHD